MNEELDSRTKLIFLLHFAVSALFGLTMLLIPDFLVELYNTTLVEPNIRLLGGAVVGYGVGSGLAYLASNWEQVRIKVLMELPWTAAAAVVLLWLLIQGEVAGLFWLNFGLFALFFAAFFALYWRYELAPEPSTA
ncbi:MAG: hypothetical protein R3300_14890 [Candidatus Promineifilaceae bacterium]|nr:hypothetical protein [Candidatus Promineifilaceae bacterium]